MFQFQLVFIFSVNMLSNEQFKILFAYKFHMYVKIDGSKMGLSETIHTCVHHRSGRVHGIR
jgi:hypothetical protein